MFKIPLIVIVTFVATLNLSVAQNHSDHQSSNFFGFPIPFQMPQFQFPHLPFFREEEAGGPPADAPSSASADAPGSSEHQEDGNQDRFFFGLLHPVSTYVACNYTTQAGTSCTSCTTALTCGSSNVGRLRACRGFFPYCNLGRCSFIPGELCVNATATG